MHLKEIHQENEPFFSDKEQLILKNFNKTDSKINDHKSCSDDEIPIITSSKEEYQDIDDEISIEDEWIASRESKETVFFSITNQNDQNKTHCSLVSEQNVMISL